ncbi:Protocadherin Fat 3 [Manis javanica]|nr:Protocadherin Fat 3 [Manis javanica]
MSWPREAAFQAFANTFIVSLQLRALEVMQKEVWASIREAYRPEDFSVPHQFRVGDPVYAPQPSSERSIAVFRPGCRRRTALRPGPHPPVG